MPVIQIATPFNIDIEFELAEFHKRLLAYIIDFLLILIYLFSILYLLYGGLSLVGEGSDGFVMIVLLLPTLLYTMMSELLMGGQTVGKKILNIKVVSLNGDEPTLGQYLLRWFLRFYEWGFIMFFLFWQNGGMGFIILIMGGVVSIIVMAVSGKNQRLGDIVAGTVVVNTRSKLTVNDTIFMHVAQNGYKVSFPDVMKLSDRDINTVKNVIAQARKNNNFEMVNRVAYKVQEVLKISSDMYALDFLEKIMEDYNYLATRE
jgi:uncharacterized RDD family membrane protein YckC